MIQAKVLVSHITENALEESVHVPVFIEGDIGPLSEYHDLLSALRRLPDSNSVIEIYLSSLGGLVSTSEVLCNAIEASSATVKIHAVGVNASSAVPLLFSADEVVLYPSSRVIIHDTKVEGADELSDSNRASLVLVGKELNSCYWFSKLPTPLYEEFENQGELVLFPDSLKPLLNRNKEIVA